MKKMEIVKQRTHLFPLPVPVECSNAIQTFTARELLVVELWTSEGISGAGYGYPMGVGGRAIGRTVALELAGL